MNRESALTCGRISLRAGPLTLEYDPQAGDLRYIRWGEREIVNRLYGAVRDDGWRTVPAAITETERTIREDSFRIAFDVRCKDDHVDFWWQGRITGAADGTVTFTFDGVALRPFLRNRIGLCALHPAALAGTDCVVTHSDGSTEVSVFPAEIAPHQPFLDIAALSYAPSPGLHATVTFEGEVFESEDQRNWLDASYKTYGTPLSIPYPVAMEAGSPVQQAIRLAITSTSETAVAVGRTAPLSCRIGVGAQPLPAGVSIGLHWPRETPDPGHTALARLRCLEPGHLRADIDACQEDWETDLCRAADLADRCGRVPLIVGLSGGASLPSQALRPWRERVTSWQLIDSIPPDLCWLREQLPERSVEIVCGASANFTELNRSRWGELPVDGLCFAGNAQMHAFDLSSILETPPVVATAIHAARRLSKRDLPIDVGPLTFYGPYLRDDPRQRGTAAAAWYAATLFHAIRAGARRVTLCEPVGPRGLLSESGAPYPAFGVVAALSAALQNAAEILEATVSDPLALSCLALRDHAGAVTVFVVNRTPVPLTVDLPDLRTSPLCLAAFGVVQLRTSGGAAR